MTMRRVVISVTAGVVTALAVALIVLRWNEANKIAVVASALAAVAAVGVGLWAGLPVMSSTRSQARVSRTGQATAGPSGHANSGVMGTSGSLPDDVRVTKTGDADASDGGDANTGIRLN